MPDILTMGSQLIGAGLGIGLSQYNDQRQIEQQNALSELQNKWDTVASNRNMQNQLELWNETNYPAQVQQMQKAGLNVAMMYKGGGQSGQIAADNTNRQAPTAANGGGMEIQQMIQQQLNQRLTEAQINNINADTKGKEINNINEGEGGINQQVKFANIDNLIANTNNTAAKTKLTEAQTIGQDITNAKDNATLEASINKAYTEMELAINMLTESDIRTGAMVENKEAFMENYKQQLAAQAILNKLNQSQTTVNNSQATVNNQQVKNLQESINLIKSQTNLNEQQIQNLLQQIVNMNTENINNTIKTNQGNVQLELKKREIDVIEKLGYMGIGSRTAVDLIDMFKNSRISQPYSGGGVGTGKPIIGFGRGNTRIN